MFNREMLERIVFIIILCAPAMCKAEMIYFALDLGVAKTAIEKNSFGLAASGVSDVDYGLSAKGGFGLKISERLALEAGGMNNDIDLDWLLDDETYATNGAYYSIHFKPPISKRANVELHFGVFDWEARLDPGWGQGEVERNGKDNFWGIGFSFNGSKKDPKLFEYENYNMNEINIHKISVKYFFGLF